MAPALLLAVALAAPVMHWPDLLQRPRPTPTLRVPYGPGPLQFAELWLPEGKGPHPVVLSVHGGCWETDTAQADIMGWLAEDLRRRGYAVWNLEYRGVDRPGGGYPGTFLDVAAGADALRGAAAAHHLALDRVVGLGHSAGGHLALWLAARPSLPRDSPLYAARPLPMVAVLALGALHDLEAAQRPPTDTCGAGPVHRLTGAAGPGRPDVYRDTSPPRLLPFATPQVLVSATLDGISPPAFAEAYAAQAARAGVRVKEVVVPGEGHVELIAPGSASWAAVVAAVEAALGRAR